MLNQKEQFIVDQEECLVTYLPRFITRDLSRQLFNELIEQKDWTSDQIKTAGGFKTSPRQTMSMGDDDCFYTYNEVIRKAIPYTPVVLQIKEQLEKYKGQKFNFVLINLYRNGDDYIGWHSDKEDDLVKGSMIASISTGAEREFYLRHRQRYMEAQKIKDRQEKLKSMKKETIKVKLNSGSLLIMAGQTQKVYQHSVPKRKGISDARINLTFRQIKSRKPIPCD